MRSFRKLRGNNFFIDEQENISYRNAKIADVDILKELGLLSYGIFKTILTPDNWKIMETNLSKTELYLGLLSKANSFVAECDHKIVGMAFLMPSGNPNHIYEADWCVIRMLGVNPEYNGRGIANKLTQLCIEAAKHNGEKTIALHTSPEIMANAIRIYLKAGFTLHKNIDPIFGVKYQLYKMDLL